jgi:DNA-binding transcriptional LysR family regulator
MLGGTVAQQIKEYISINDRIRFQITEGSAEALMDLVRQEKLDMAMVDTTNRDRSLHFRKLGQKNFVAVLPKGHPLESEKFLLPQQLSNEVQVGFHYDVANSFGHWASGEIFEENVVCNVNTAQAALDLVAAGVGICLISEACVQNRKDVSYVPVRNWYQALYMCILYDKWLEPPIWGFVDELVKVIRRKEEKDCL